MAKRKVSVVETIDSETGIVTVPEGFWEALDQRMEESYGKDIKAVCNQCGYPWNTREKLWKGLCPYCREHQADRG